MTPAGAAHLPSRAQARAFRGKHQKRLTGTTVAAGRVSAGLIAGNGLRL